MTRSTIRIALPTAAAMLLSVQLATADGPVSFQTSWSFSHGPVDPTYMAIKSHEQWLQLWRRIKDDHDGSGIGLNIDKIPETDFNRYTLIVAGSGKKPMSGYAVSFRSVIEGRDAIRVTVLETGPGSRCAGDTISTSPFIGALIPATGKKVIFETKYAEATC